MHTTHLKKSDNRWIVVLHNGDWSGNVELRWGREDDNESSIDGEVKLPGWVGRALAANLTEND